MPELRAFEIGTARGIVSCWPATTYGRLRRHQGWRLLVTERDRASVQKWIPANSAGEAALAALLEEKGLKPWE